MNTEQAREIVEESNSSIVTYMPRHPHLEGGMLITEEINGLMRIKQGSAYYQIEPSILIDEVAAGRCRLVY